MDHWQDLISPIRDDAPAGDDLSFSMEFDAIQEARRADDPTLDQGEWVTDIKYADWPGAAKQCRELLRNRTKDLRVASWLAEANTQLHGFAGLAGGYRLIAYFCDHYWDTVYPMMDQGDAEERVGNLVWLLTQSQQWLRTLPLVNAPQGRFGLNDFETVFSRAENTEQDPGDHPDQDQLQAARRDTSPDYYRRLLEEIPDCGAALRELRDAVDRHLGVDGPSFSAAEDLLTLLNQTVRRFARDANVDVPGDDTEALAGDPNPPIISATAAASQGGPIQSRQQALEQLRDVAAFFRRTEPHSPVAYLAERAARWGEMPLHQWLKTVIKDDGILSQVEELLDVERERDQDMT